MSFYIGNYTKWIFCIVEGRGLKDKKALQNKSHNFIPNLRSNISSDLVPNSNGVVSSGNPTISEVAVHNKYFFISRLSRTFSVLRHVSINHLLQSFLHQNKIFRLACISHVYPCQYILFPLKQRQALSNTRHY